VDPRGLPAPEKIWIEGKSRCGRTTSSRRGPESTGGKRTASTRRSGSNPVGEARRAPPVTGPAIPAPRSFSGGTPRNPRGRAVSRSGRRLRAIVPGPDRHSSRGSAGPSDPCTGFEIETESFRDKAQASSDVAKGTSDPRPAISQSLRRRLGLDANWPAGRSSVPASREARTRRTILAVEGSGREGLRENYGNPASRASRPFFRSAEPSLPAIQETRTVP